MNKLITVIGRKFKFQVQDSDLEYLFWRFDKNIALSENKLPLPKVGDTYFELEYIKFADLKQLSKVTPKLPPKLP